MLRSFNPLRIFRGNKIEFLSSFLTASILTLVALLILKANTPLFKNFLLFDFLVIASFAKLYIYYNQSENKKIIQTIKNTAIAYTILLLLTIYLASVNIILFESNILHLIKLVFFLTALLAITSRNENEFKASSLSFKNTIDWKVYFLLAVLIFFGLCLRLQGISNLSIWVDEANSVLVSERIYNNLGQTLMSGDPYYRAFLYHHALSYVFAFFPDHNLAGRLFNIPFFIMACVYLFKFGVKLKNTYVGLLSVFIFSFSWYSISIFRDIRFYEIFIASFIATNYYLMLIIDSYFKLDIRARGVKNFLSERNNLSNLLLLLIFAAVSTDSQAQTSLLIYLFFPLGIFLFALHNKKEALALSFFSFIAIVQSTIYLYEEIIFSPRNLLTPPPPQWKLSFGNLGFFDFYNYLLLNSYWYLIITIPVFFVIVIKYKKFSYTYLFCLFTSMFFMVAYQGFGLIALRYYYIAFPFAVLITAIVIEKYLDNISKFPINGLFKKNLLLLFLILIFYSNYTTAIQESFSSLTYDSRNETRNINYREIFSIVERMKLAKENKYNEKVLIVTDTELNMPLFINSGILADFIFQSSPIQAESINRYTGVRDIFISDLDKIGNPKIAIYFKRRKYFLKNNNEQIRPSVRDYLNKNSETIYDDGTVVIKFIKPLI